MKMLSKRLSLILLALCVAVCAGALAACKDKSNDGSNAYTVTVQTSDNTPAVGVRVTLGKGNAQFDTQTTGADGKVSFDVPDDTYTVKLSKLPENFTVADNADLTLSPTKRNLTVTLAEAFHYTVRIVGKDGKVLPATVTENVTVGVCTLDSNCLSPVALNTADGIAKLYVAKNSYHVQILGLPDDWTYDKDANGYYAGADFLKDSDETEMTIKVYPKSTVNVLQANGLTQYEDKDAHRLVGIPLLEDAVVYKSADGIYRYQIGEQQQANDPQIVVRLTTENPTSRYQTSGVPIIYAEKKTNNTAKYVFKATPDADKNDPFKGDTYVDYRTLLRGFGAYDITIGTDRNPIFTEPSQKATHYYAKYVNSDGVYPLNDELKTFLQLYCQNNSMLIEFNVEALKGSEWLFPCYYYEEIPAENPALIEQL